MAFISPFYPKLVNTCDDESVWIETRIQIKILHSCIQRVGEAILKNNCGVQVGYVFFYLNNKLTYTYCMASSMTDETNFLYDDSGR